MAAPFCVHAYAFEHCDSASSHAAAAASALMRSQRRTCVCAFARCRSTQHTTEHTVGRRSQSPKLRVELRAGCGVQNRTNTIVTTTITPHVHSQWMMAEIAIHLRGLSVPVAGGAMRFLSGRRMRVTSLHRILHCSRHRRVASSAVQSPLNNE